MTTISGTSASSAWANVGSDRAARMQQRMFTKADTNGDGSVDKSELQTMLDKIADKTGGTAASADDLFSKMDSDGSGSLSSDELDAGMKSLMPPPSSTVDFAQQRGMDGPPPPPDDSSSTGDVGSLMKDIFKAADSNGDGTLSSTEIDGLKTKIDDAIDAVMQSLQASGTSSNSTTGVASGSTSSSTSATDSQSTSTATSTQDSVSLSTLLDRVLKQYAASSATAAQQSAGSLITTSA